MVPLATDPLARGFAAQLEDLRRALSKTWRPEAPDAAFVDWAAAEAGTPLGVQLPVLAVEELTHQRWNEAPILASIGYLLGRGQIDVPDERWRGGIEKLMGRDVAPADRNSFLYRPLELLGLAVGARASADGSVSEWLRRSIEDHADGLARSALLPASLNHLASRAVGATSAIPARVDPAGSIELATAVWLGLVDRDLAGSLIAETSDIHQRRLLEAAFGSSAIPAGLAETGIIVIALTSALATVLGSLTFTGQRPAETVVGLCRRFPLLVAELGRRHARRAFSVDDEYDVQDLLRGILRLHFDDVRVEEWNPSYGGVQSRSDLLLKAERVVVETKMTRKSLGQSELVKELIVDKSQYRRHPDCGTLVCFVYDPEHRLQNPTAVEDDLSGTEAGLSTRVVVAPIGL